MKRVEPTEKDSELAAYNALAVARAELQDLAGDKIDMMRKILSAFVAVRNVEIRANKILRESHPGKRCRWIGLDEHHIVATAFWLETDINLPTDIEVHPYSAMGLKFCSLIAACIALNLAYNLDSSLDAELFGGHLASDALRMSKD